MSSRSSNNPADRRLLVGRIAGHRGPHGEMTVRVLSGDAARWSGVRWVLLTPPAGEGAERYEVQRSRAYRDRLVLKLEEIDDGNSAEALRGHRVWAEADQVPGLPEGTHYAERLIGLRVVEIDGAEVGTVRDVIQTGGTDLLAVEDERGREVLIPMARETVRRVDEGAQVIEVELTEGLRELNPSEDAG